MVIRDAAPSIDRVRIALQIEIHQDVQSRLHHLCQLHVDPLRLTDLTENQRLTSLRLAAPCVPLALPVLLVVVILPDLLLRYISPTPTSFTFRINVEDRVVPLRHTLARLFFLFRIAPQQPPVLEDSRVQHMTHFHYRITTCQQPNPLCTEEDS